MTGAAKSPRLRRSRVKKPAAANTAVVPTHVSLSMAGLVGAGAFTGRPIRKEIEWSQDGKTYIGEVFVRPMGYQTAVAHVLSHGGQQDPIASRIAASICDEKGVPIFTVADITGHADPERGALDGGLTVALLAAISEVNSLGKTTG